MKRNAVAVLCVFLFAGCYTQFAYVNRAAIEGMPPDSALPADSASAYIRDSVPANPNQVCYWTRDMWGRPQLVCEDADYGRDWYRYSEYPWWNRSDPYFFGSYNSYGWDHRCPAYYYYDNSCGACRYYSGYAGGDHGTWWWNSSGQGSPGSQSSSSKQLRNRNGRTQGIPNASQRASGIAIPLSKPKAGSGSSSAGPGVGANAPSSTSPGQRVRNGRTEGIPTSGEVEASQERQRAEENAVREINNQAEAEKQQASPPPAPQEQRTAPASQPAPSTNTAPPPSSTSGQDNSSSGSSGAGSRGGRNERGW